MSEPVRFNVSTRSGTVRVLADTETELWVEGGEVAGDQDGTLDIRRNTGSNTIVVHCPPGTDATVGTMSGKVDLHGPLGVVRIATVSGHVRVEDAQQVDVRAKSGAVEIGTCAGECRIVVTSSKVHIGKAQRAAIAGVSSRVIAEGIEGADVKTVSGKVVLSLTGAGRVNVHTVSGRVEITVPRDVHPDARLRSISGKILNDCPGGGDGEIAVKSVSGAIRVLCA